MKLIHNRYAVVAFGVAVFVLFAAISSGAQDRYCAAGWKKGNTAIQPQSLVINLDISNSSFTKRINDTSGAPKYELSVTPGTVGKSKEIIEWIIELQEINAADQVDLLKPANDPGQDSFSAEDNPGWFYLGEKGQARDAAIPFLTKRVIRVENFYVTLQVKKYKRNRAAASVIDSASFEISFLNLRRGDRISRECK